MNLLFIGISQAMKQRIHTYLLEQGIDIDKNLVKDAAQVLSIILTQADIQTINRHKVWQQKDMNLSSILPKYTEETLCRLLAATDTVKTHLSAELLSIFLLHNQNLIRISHSGTQQFSTLLVNNDTACQHLASRVALSAWFNQVEHTNDWVKNQELSSEFYPNNVTAWALPICTDTGGVLGVVYGEQSHSHTINDEQFAWLLGLAIAAQTPLLSLFHDLID